MEKCKDCYWKERGKVNEEDWCGFEGTEPNTCKYFEYQCDECQEDEAKYEYKGKKYCFDCLMEELEVESYTTTNYYLNGEALGNEDDIDDVIDHLDEDIKKLEDE